MTQVLELKNLTVSFKIDEETFTAVQDVSLSLEKGKVLGIVGESGCGKSVTAMSILRLLAPNAVIDSGEILFMGQNLLEASPKEMQQIRGSRIALIPQDPLTSLTPLYTVGDQIIETIRLHKGINAKEAEKLAIQALKDVKIPEARRRMSEYPHQFSGGMSQRVLIALALCCEPDIIIADEPTTALDVTVQAQILDLIKKIQEEKHTSLIFITHDLGVVAEFCNYVAVMYAGNVVEYADTRTLFRNPLHPYTKGLFESLPTPDKEELNIINGQPPSITEEIPGCPFNPRCPQRMKMCDKEKPLPVQVGDGRQVSCYLFSSSSGSKSLITPNSPS